MLTRQASNIANIIEGNIITRTVKNLSAMFPLMSLPFMAANEFGRIKSALWPEVASKLSALKNEVILNSGG